MPSKKSTRQSKINRLSTQTGRAGIKNTTISHYTHRHTALTHIHTHTNTAWHISAYGVRPSQLPFYGQRFKFFMQAATADLAIVSLPLPLLPPLPPLSLAVSFATLYAPLPLALPPAALSVLVRHRCLQHISHFVAHLQEFTRTASHPSCCCLHPASHLLPPSLPPHFSVSIVCY